MSTHSTNRDTSDNNLAAEAVRRAFAALPFDQRITTLVQVEMDILGDVAGTIVATASRVVDDIARAFDGSNGTATGPSPAGGQAPTS